MMTNDKRLIDANAFIEEHCAECKYFNVNGLCTKDDPVCGSVMIVAELPTVDAVEVVRCKDCKHAYINSFSAISGVALCKHWTNQADGKQAITQHDDFCSYGERREGE